MGDAFPADFIKFLHLQLSTMYYVVAKYICGTGGLTSIQAIDIRPGDMAAGPVCALLALHLAGMHAVSPPGTVYALDLGGLSTSDIRVWTAWIGDRLAGIGALKALGNGAGEIKSMRTDPDFLRRGVAKALLDHLIGAAKARQMTRLSLETGSGPEFEAALALYRRNGFANGAAFGDYLPSAFNQFLHRNL